MLRFFIVAPLVLLSSAVCFGQDGRKPAEKSSRLMTFEALQARLGEPGLRLFDARPRADYDKGHIPGAIWVDAKGVEELAAKPGALTDRAVWESWIAHLGIGPETEVFVYDARRQLDAARIWWLLGYLGVEKAGLIDGNFPLWAAKCRPVTTDTPKVETRPFRVVFRKDRHATKEEVLAAIGAKSALIVDARSEGEFSGTEKRSRRGGHVPTACSLEWNNLVDKDGRFLGDAALREKIAKAGVRSGEPVITHCQGGGRASVNAFVLERLGFKTRNYYLGWSDWGNAADTPVESGKGDPPSK